MLATSKENMEQVLAALIKAIFAVMVGGPVGLPPPFFYSGGKTQNSKAKKETKNRRTKD
jgi:hypothetical protein